MARFSTSNHFIWNDFVYIAYFPQRWYDHYMQWNPEDYNGSKEIKIDSELLWKPDITLYNE